MERGAPIAGLQIFSTCPPPSFVSPGDYLERVRSVARRTEEAGCEGLLVPTDHGLVDPWLVSQVVVESSERLAPLIAVQTASMHPYSVARMVSSFAYLHGRRVHLSIEPGSMSGDAALDDETSEPECAGRLIEYVSILQGLLHSPDALAFEGRYYRVRGLGPRPSVPPSLAPRLFLSGASPGTVDAASRLGMTVIDYPRPTCGCGAVAGAAARAVSLGIIARDSESDAWRTARARFPEGSEGESSPPLPIEVSQSSWRRQLTEHLPVGVAAAQPYWRVPFERDRLLCPYLVGSYDRVADEVARYVEAGCRTFIIDVPAAPEELEHIGEVFERAVCAFAVG
ncbi:MAG TPA: LLM class flavin-dependent oxidoreductase [Burkholderiales bacterium]|nr:LLM class flavin-dependent oxidoreductase [Burkholderiales bacterium]